LLLGALARLGIGEEEPHETRIDGAGGGETWRGHGHHGGNFLRVAVHDICQPIHDAVHEVEGRSLGSGDEQVELVAILRWRLFLFEREQQPDRSRHDQQQQDDGGGTVAQEFAEQVSIASVEGLKSRLGAFIQRGMAATQHARAEHGRERQ